LPSIYHVDPTCTNHSHVGLTIHNFPDLVLVHFCEFHFHCRFPAFPFARRLCLAVTQRCRGRECVCKVVEWVLGVCEGEWVIRVVTESLKMGGDGSEIPGDGLNGGDAFWINWTKEPGL
jgi:hypothetical protein